MVALKGYETKSFLKSSLGNAKWFQEWILLSYSFETSYLSSNMVLPIVQVFSL
jgi:hypothetical protein